MNLKNYKKITWQIIDNDNVINWVLGISLILVPDFFNRLIFGHEVISHWIYILMGLGCLWFAIWQLDNFIKNRQLTEQALRFSAFLDWLWVLLLSFALLSSLGGRMLLISRILLWVINLSLLARGGWFWWVSAQIESA